MGRHTFSKLDTQSAIRQNDRHTVRLGLVPEQRIEGIQQRLKIFLPANIESQLFGCQEINRDKDGGNQLVHRMSRKSLMNEWSQLEAVDVSRTNPLGISSCDYRLEIHGLV